LIKTALIYSVSYFNLGLELQLRVKTPPWQQDWWQLLWLMACCETLVAVITWTGNRWHL